MRKLVLFCATLCAMVLSMSASPVRAQAFVSTSGSDSNNCYQAFPCATFQGVLNKYASVPIIICLTSGEYGPFTVTASITVDCGAGNVGNVAVTTSTAITINAPA